MIPENIEQNFSHIVVVTGARTWDDETTMRRALNEQWSLWGPQSVSRPLLISGSCTHGADALAEKLWRAAGFEMLSMPADWSIGRTAGFVRNQQMIDAAQVLAQAGAEVALLAFLDPCTRNRCPQQEREQLLPVRAGHFSHGTVDCRERALQTGLEIRDVLRP